MPTQLGALRQHVPNRALSCGKRSAMNSSIVRSEFAPAIIDIRIAHSSGSSAYRLPCARRASCNSENTPPNTIFVPLPSRSHEVNTDKRKLTTLGYGII